MNHQNLTAGFLYAGGGGCTSGSVAAGFKPLFAVEHDKFAASVYRKRFPECQLIEEDITTLTDDFIRSLPVPDVIIWGSPCPDFSYSGNRAGITGDRGQLFFEGIRFLKILQPSISLFENVEGLLSSNSNPSLQSCARIIRRYQEGGWGLQQDTYQLALKVKEFHKGSDFKRMLWEFGQVGYECVYQLRNGRRWVPQNRSRVFVVGCHRKYSMHQNRAA